MAEAPPIEALVPHRGPALFLEAVVAWEMGSITCRGRIPAGAALVRDRRAPSYLGLELLAQSAAVLEALAARAASPRIGYLVGVRQARFLVGELPVEAPLLAVVREAGRAGPLGVFDGRLERDGVECVTAIFSTYSKP